VIVMTPRLLVREAVPADFSAIRAVLAAANEEFRGRMGPTLFAGYLANVLDVERRAQEAELFVAELGGEIVGTVTFYRDASAEGMGVSLPAGAAGFRAMAIHPAARGGGVGHRLVATCIDRARQLRAGGIVIHTAESMVAAIGLYERHGFRRMPEYDFEASPFFGGAEVDALLAIAFVLPLGERGGTRQAMAPTSRVRWLLQNFFAGWREVADPGLGAATIDDALRFVPAVGMTSGADLRAILRPLF
jgi:ribosomal protein S18 acetylase RimI-like enzyme